MTILESIGYHVDGKIPENWWLRCLVIIVFKDWVGLDWTEPQLGSKWAVRSK